MVENPQKIKVRLNLDLTQKVKGQMESIQQRTDAASFVEVIRRAVAVYDMLLEHEESGGRVFLVNPDQSKELLRLV